LESGGLGEPRGFVVPAGLEVETTERKLDDGVVASVREPLEHGFGLTVAAAAEELERRGEGIVVAFRMLGQRRWGGEEHRAEREETRRTHASTGAHRGCPKA